MQTWVVGVDLGGTKIATGLVDDRGQVIERLEQLTRPEQGPQTVIERMTQSVGEVCRRAGVRPGAVEAVTVACPGPLDPASGVVIAAPNLGWRHVDVVGPMQAALGVPVYLENDANAAAFGEWWVGAGRGTRHFIYVTVSTGIGGGIIIDGAIYGGAHWAAGEIGHTVIVVENGPLCGCGRRGCLESVASGTGIARRAIEALEEAGWREGEAPEAADERPGARLVRLAAGRFAEIDARKVAEAARQGDPLAKEVLDRTWLYLGAGLANLANLFDPDAIAIGGGVSRIGEAMMEPLRRELRTRAVPGPAEGTRLVPALLGPNAGVVGAAAVALKKLGKLEGVESRAG
ncbi:ROK family protein [Carboxydochorda subterranea]|uniref:ROK family protein n=1 Tax=Carboxydichorda subterranea TaxID=3109565 RepID=A0ABZ1BZK4_9FIRM|nr:ROK family protein [Limnochorda sp. L945t]WRP18018.1 ROK family protein [Limnochorda sp. L945t]